MFLKNVSKHYAKLENFNLEIKQGEFVVLLGANGSGKSTLLNIIAGLVEPDSGEIIIEDSKIGYVFQNYRDSLLPWKTNLENIAFPLELEGVDEALRLKKASELVASLGLDLPLEKYPYKSSGGQQQFVAILREILAEPKIILMDEPFSALHYESRTYLQSKIKEIWKKLGLTILFVTHDREEADRLAERIVELK